MILINPPLKTNNYVYRVPCSSVITLKARLQHKDFAVKY